MFLSDGGLETVLVFERGMDLPDFASFPLLSSTDGRETLRGYTEAYLEIARRRGMAGFVAETPTWRASPDWVRRWVERTGGAGDMSVEDRQGR